MGKVLPDVLNNTDPFNVFSLTIHHVVVLLKVNSCFHGYICWTNVMFIRDDVLMTNKDLSYCLTQTQLPLGFLGVMSL